MSRYRVTINKESGLAVIRTLQEHGKGLVNQSLFHGVNRKIIPLAA